MALTYGQFQRRPLHAREQIRIAQLEHQGGRCALCDLPVPPEHRHKLVVDHCHTTGRVRGLLCCACNMAMAAVDRGDDWLQRARRYRDDGAWMSPVGQAP